jgi:acyl CoA:acetate/3-ketoacid CoA transferase beta subunit
MAMSDFSLAELCIAACAEVWRDDGEVLATGITIAPRLAAGLAKLTFNPALMMTDAEVYLLDEPVPVGPRGDYAIRPEGWMSYARTFDNIYGGKRHALVAPVQIDRFGQTNISTIGERGRPKAALLGVRGYPGNSTCAGSSPIWRCWISRAPTTRSAFAPCTRASVSRRYRRRPAFPWNGRPRFPPPPRQRPNSCGSFETSSIRTA